MDVSRKIAAVIDLCGDLTEDDFAALAKACLDQAGISVAVQKRVEALVDEDLARNGRKAGR